MGGRRLWEAHILLLGLRIVCGNGAHSATQGLAIRYGHTSHTHEKACRELCQRPLSVLQEVAAVLINHRLGSGTTAADVQVYIADTLHQSFQVDEHACNSPRPVPGYCTFSLMKKKSSHADQSGDNAAEPPRASDSSTKKPAGRPRKNSIPARRPSPPQPVRKSERKSPNVPCLTPAHGKRTCSQRRVYR
uniref:Secreted protein n=1 Tax=Steinernema glaseri TaxID=37863 RepID=A0A1I7Y7I6_9BILA